MMRQVHIVLMLVLLALTGPSMAAARHAVMPAGTIVICVGDAVQVVQVDESGQPVDAPHICPECLVVAALDVAQQRSFAQTLDFALITWASARAHPDDRRVVHGALARAPPFRI